MVKLDILALAAHPDDVEISCSGTLLQAHKSGYKTGILDFTKGELGTRGTAQTRAEEAKEASEIMGLHWRDNLDLGDGFFEVEDRSLKAVIRAIRATCPKTLLINAPRDRHPDHGRGSELAQRAAFLSGLIKIDTEGQQPWRPTQVFHYIQDHFIEPDLVVDISSVFKERMASMMAYKSQFFDPNSKEPKTPISGKEFLDMIEYRARQFGRYIGQEFGEGFLKTKPVGVPDITQLF